MGFPDLLFAGLIWTLVSGIVQGQTIATPPTVSNSPGPDSQEPLMRAIPSPALPREGWTRYTIPVAACKVPPHLDGKLDDSCWKSAMHAAGFYRFGTSAPVDDQTEVWLCADKTHLYIAFHCLDREPGRIQAAETQRDSLGLFQDDFVGVDIDSQNSRHNFSTFAVNPRGTQYTQLEGGTADNITWAGDWKAAVRRTANGWSAEMAIPFVLMRYPRGAHSFGILLYRKLYRETTLTSWPYVPPPGTASNPAEAQYMEEFSGIAPPFFAPRPIFLPYALATAGSGSSVREGMDIKYPLSTTLTGVATLFPDFQTIEQDITSINFSYNEKLLTDRRPFFAEGADFLPAQDLFYSRRIGAVDGGLKVAGKNGNTTLGLLGTDTQGPQGQGALAMNVREDLGLLSNVGLNFVADNQIGQPSNRVARLFGAYGWRSGLQQYTLSAFHTQSYQNGRRQGGDDDLNLGNASQPGRLQFTLDLNDIGPDFVSNLGYVPDTNLRGANLVVHQFNQFDKGIVDTYDSGLTLNSYRHHSGGFFYRTLSPYLFVGGRSGWGIETDYTLSQRDEFHDHVSHGELSWNRKSLFQRGRLGDAFGRQAGQTYNFLNFRQGLLIAPQFSLQMDFNRLLLGDTISTQSILTGTYRLSADRTLGGRVVKQNSNADVYFSFGQHVRTGTDFFVLFGDPNSERTRGKVTFKLVRPF